MVEMKATINYQKKEKGKLLKFTFFLYYQLYVIVLDYSKALA